MNQPALKLDTSVIDFIDAYPDFNELLAEATAEPFPVHGEDRIAFVRSHVAQLKAALLEQDDAEVGRMLRELIESQAREWWA